MRRSLTLLAMTALGLTVSFFAVLAQRSDYPDPAGASPLAVSWVSAARTVAEVTAEADAVVRVRVSNVSPTRAVVKPLPEDGRRFGRPTVDVVPFTESTMQVLEVYKGAVGDQLVVSQTGGRLPATDAYPSLNVVLPGNPLFVPGSEHILFLVGPTEIGGQQQVFRPVNPAGRYEIRGAKASSPADFFGPYAPPATLADLVGRIEVALGGG